ncbi:MAG TPA: response regulator [Candidatus Hydrogenedens sp.]|nr:response regulator [Candidatus Hydrogenedens sp.]HOK08229.1 response regulator [Candidatus Hydrogenedens sp.]HPP59180.1 response regulator [Candidatus Hydrogenedens sp.]
MKEHSPKIIILDDEIDLTEMLSIELKDRGYVPKTVFNPKEFLKCFANEMADLVIIDLRLPEIFGTDIITMLKNININIPPIIVITAYNDYPNYVLYNLGAEAIIYKPFELKMLLHNVERLLTPLPERFQINIEKITDYEGWIENLDSKEIHDILLGRGGFSLISSERYSIGTTVRFTLNFPQLNNQQGEGIGIIRWKMSSHESKFVNKYGIEFVNISDILQKHLLIWINETKPVQYIPYE